MKTLVTSFFILLLAVCMQSQIVEHTYDFNDLAEGNLDGQDYWTTVVNATGSNNEMDVAYAYQGIVSHNATKAVFYGQSCPNCGRTGSRESQDNFPFDFTVGGIVEIELDIHTGWWGTLFGFGYDANDNGYLMPALETVITIEDDEGGFGFHIAKKDLPQMRSFYLPDGSLIQYTFPLTATDGWHRYKLFLDLDANDGAGSISMFVAEIGGTFIPVSEITEINLEMTPGSGTSSDPATWTKMFLHATGGTSGFENMLIKQPNTGGLLYQYITFNPLGDHLTTDAPFTVEATSSQGLEVMFAVESGPATLNGNIITLTGDPGIVEIVAFQPGNDTVAAADSITQSFEVIDPLTIIPELDIKNPVIGGEVRMPDLMSMPFVVLAEIEHPDLLFIQEVEFEIDGNTFNGYETNNGYFIGNWAPLSYGIYNVDVTVYSSGGPSTSGSVSFEIIPEAPSMDFPIIEDFVFTGQNSIDTTFVLPGFVGTYSKITAVINYGCPCEEWDVPAYVKIRGANGEWMELLKYITPYGVACDDQIDITDFASQLQGKVDFNIIFPESVTSVTFVYDAGTPEYNYSWMDNLWQAVYPFGDYSNMHPIEPHILNFSPNIEKAHIRLLCSGHAWGENNTGNAAEFYEATHNINLNGNTEFQQHLWQTCNPNPVGCQPQNGTWFYNRHGWCPGSIPILYQYDITSWITIPDLLLEYEFYPDYIDYCHPSHPDCVSGVTCPSCNSTYNPNIKVAGGLVTFSNDLIITSIKETVSFQELRLTIAPNPSNGIFSLSTSGKKVFDVAYVRVYNMTGTLVDEYLWDGAQITIDLSDCPNGVYVLSVQAEDGIKTERLIIQ